MMMMPSNVCLVQGRTPSWSPRVTGLEWRQIHAAASEMRWRAVHKASAFRIGVSCGRPIRASVDVLTKWLYIMVGNYQRMKKRDEKGIKKK